MKVLEILFPCIYSGPTRCIYKEAAGTRRQSKIGSLVSQKLAVELTSGLVKLQYWNFRIGTKLP